MCVGISPNDFILGMNHYRHRHDVIYDHIS